MTGWSFAAAIARFLGRTAPKCRPATRLTEADVLAVATGTIMLSPIMVLDVEQQAETIVWTVGTRNKGANEWVEIDDATGAVASHRFFGSR